MNEQYIFPAKLFIEAKSEDEAMRIVAEEDWRAFATISVVGDPQKATGALLTSLQG
jgi:hypothetical protein